MTNRIWICIALITLVLALGALPKVERAVSPVNIGSVFR